MINKIVGNLFRFIFLVIVQITVMDNIQLNGYLNPFIYVVFILMLPFETPGWLLLLLGFIAGITIDIFAGTGGIHAAATVFMAFCRPRIIRIISPRDGYEAETKPSINNMGIRWFLTYSITLVLLHHTALFFIESFKLSEFLPVFLRAIQSAALTLLLIVMGSFLFARGKVVE